MSSFAYIGVARTPFQTIENMPIQGADISKEEGVLEIDDAYVEGLRDLDGFSHCYVIFHLHKMKSPALTVKPFLDTKTRGVFATRSPKRPNGIGLSIVRINRVEGNRVIVSELDLLDGTPILDIKPYIMQFDGVVSERDGWYTEGLDAQSAKSDNRFKE